MQGLHFQATRGRSFARFRPGAVVEIRLLPSHQVSSCAGQELMLSQPNCSDALQ